MANSSISPIGAANIFTAKQNTLNCTDTKFQSSRSTSQLLTERTTGARNRRSRRCSVPKISLRHVQQQIKSNSRMVRVKLIYGKPIIYCKTSNKNETHDWRRANPRYGGTRLKIAHKVAHVLTNQPTDQLTNLIAVSQRNTDCSIRCNSVATIYLSNSTRRWARLMIQL